MEKENAEEPVTQNGITFSEMLFSSAIKQDKEKVYNLNKISIWYCNVKLLPLFSFAIMPHAILRLLLFILPYIINSTFFTTSSLTFCHYAVCYFTVTSFYIALHHKFYLLYNFIIYITAPIALQLLHRLLLFVLILYKKISHILPISLQINPFANFLVAPHSHVTLLLLPCILLCKILVITSIFAGKCLARI